jgi:hypothetical protein
MEALATINWQETGSVGERLWSSPPPDRTIPEIPRGARARSAAAVAAHIERELVVGRSLYCIVRDRFVAERVSEFDGRVLIGRNRPGAGG